LFSIATTGVGQAEPLFSSDKSLFSNSWSADGRFLAFVGRTFSRKDAWNIWILPMFGDEKPFEILHSNFDHWDAVFSLDGRWLAYQSDENGRDEIYVVPFPNAESKLLVSTGGGSNPRWSPDGKELYYIAADESLAAVSLQKERNGLRVSATNSFFFDVSHDGKRFLVYRDAENQAPLSITLITNWSAAFEKVTSLSQ
jgi:Tol biopolymer transport system component